MRRLPAASHSDGWRRRIAPGVDLVSVVGLGGVGGGEDVAGATMAKKWRKKMRGGDGKIVKDKDKIGPK